MHIFARPNGPIAGEEYKPPSWSASPVDDSHKFSHVSSRGDSPPLTSSLHSRHSASSAQEEAYLRKASILKWIRLVFAVTAVGVAAGAVGISSHVLEYYNSMKMAGEWNLSVWPLDIDVRPTIAILVPGVLAILAALIYIAFAIIPSPHSRFLVQNFVFTGLSVAAVIATLTSVIFVYTVHHHAEKQGGRDTIQSWTCFFNDNAQSFAHDTELLGIPALTDALLPEGFPQVCERSQVASWLMVALLLVELACVGVGLVGLVAEKSISKVRQARYSQGHEEKSSNAA